MKRSGYIQRKTPLTSKLPPDAAKWWKPRKPLRQKSTSETTKLKDSIQALLRDIAILRDGGCVIRFVQGIGSAYDFGIPFCNGYRKDGELILQFDHLLTRANAATYADSRLGVCVCKGHHGWKKYHEKEYEAVIRSLLPPERVLLWDKAVEARRQKTSRKGSYDWRLEEAALRAELKRLQAN